MAVRNDIDRFHLVSDVIDRVPKLGSLAAYTKQAIREKLIDHQEYVARCGEDMPEIRDWPGRRTIHPDGGLGADPRPELRERDDQA